MSETNVSPVVEEIPKADHSKCDHDHGQCAHEPGKEAEVKKLRQEVEIKDIGPCKKHIKVSVSREDIDDRMNDHFKTMMGDTAVRGFRPGKAPRKVVERRFQKEVGDQVKTEVLMASLEQLAEDHDIAPLSPPELDPQAVVIPKDGPLVYEFDVEVRPQFDLPLYKGLKLTRYVHTFTPEEIDGQYKSMLEIFAEKVEKNPPVVAEGDQVKLEALIQDGETKVGEFKGLEVRVSKQLAFRDGVAENFLEQIQGAKAGEVRQIDIKLSSMVANEALSGKTVQAKVTIQEVKSFKIPEDLGYIFAAYKCKNAEQLKEMGEVILKRRLEYQQKQAVRKQVLEQVAASTTWDLPQDLLRRQAKRILSRKVMDMQSNGLSDNEINARVRLMQQDILESTALALKEHFVLQKIAEVEKLEVNDSDLEREIDRIAGMNDESPRKVRARLEKDDLLEALAVEVIERKALDLILESAEYDEKPLGGAEDLRTETAEVDAAPAAQEGSQAPAK